MKHRTLLFALMAALVVVAVVWCKSRFTQQALSERSAQPTATTSLLPPASYPGAGQINAGVLTPEEIRAEVKRRDGADRSWEWKIPIKFYGRVVDQDGEPVAEAEIHFQWTNISSKGTADSDVKSDAQGSFSITGIEGKRLLVRLKKNGYYSSDPRNRWSFEYANPFEEIFHEPKPQTPVMFYLRRQAPSADVTSKAVEVILPGDGTSTRVQVETGQIGKSGDLLVQAWKPWPPRPMSPRYDWKVNFMIENGGFIDAPDQFAFEAPEIGYTPDYTIDMRASSGSEWRVSVERTLYFVFGNPRKYGRLNLRTDGNSRYIFLDYVINSSGARSLEAAPAP